MKLLMLLNLWPPFDATALLETVPTMEGPEFTMSVNRPHFTLIKNRGHFTVPMNRPHFEVSREN